MARPEKLGTGELEALTDMLRGWERQDDKLIAERAFADFASAIGFANAVAIHAEAMDHHPDINIYGWNKVRLTLTTHDAGGLTILDFDLAKKINGIAF